jgi:hypothetical protein
VYAQVPALHVALAACVTLQTVPQVPQLSASVCVSASQPLYAFPSQLP